MSKRAGAVNRRKFLITAMKQAFENLVYEEAEDGPNGARRSGMRMFRGALSGLWLIEVKAELARHDWSSWDFFDNFNNADWVNAWATDPKILWKAGLATVTYEANPGSGTTQTQWVVSIGASGLAEFFTEAIE